MMIDKNHLYKKKDWKLPEIMVIPFKNTSSGENQTDNEETAGQGYEETGS